MVGEYSPAPATNVAVRMRENDRGLVKCMSVLQWVSDPSSRFCDAPGAPSVTASTKAC
jgi:hypothetical protein